MNAGKYLIVWIFLAASAVQSQDISAGKQVYDTWCIHCHGEEVPWSGGGTRNLRIKYEGELPAILEERTDMQPEFIEFYVRNGVSNMPIFRKVEITDKNLADLIAYLTRNNP